MSAAMHYEIRLYPLDAVGQANRRATQSGSELETALGEPDRIETFDTLPELAAAMPSLPNDLTPLMYAVADDGGERPVSIMELAQALAQ